MPDMEASSKVKKLLDELASVLAEMGAVQDSDDTETTDAGDDMVEQNGMNPAEGEAEDADKVEDTQEVEGEKQKKLRCLCERAEKLRDQIKFYEGVAAKELELRAVLDKSTPAKIETRNAKETPVTISPMNLPGAGRLKNFRGPRAEERAYRAGQFFRATLLKDKDAQRWCSDHGVTESRALNEGVNSQGGIFVNEEILNEIIVLVEEFGAFPANARNITMKSDTLIIPRRVGGLKAYFVGENASVQESDAAWDRVQMVAKKTAVASRISSEILEDSSVLNLADYLTGEVSRAVAELIDVCAFVGTGSGDFGGIVGVVNKITDGNHAAGVVTAGSGETGASTLKLESLIAAAGRLPLYARGNAKWYVNPAVFSASVQRLGLVNNVGIAGGNTPASVSAGAEMRLLGYPIVFVHTLSNNVSADPGVVKFLFGDLSLSSYYATRRGLTIKQSTERYAELDQTLLVSTMRWDAVTADCGDANRAGPIVALKTAAS
jgi:HK97 family phage major capsid protein